MSNQFTPRPSIYAVFPSNKLGFFVEDATNLDKAKIRVAMVPTKQGSGEAVEFYIDLDPARVIFADLGELGQLRPDCLTKEINGKQGKVKVFDLFAKIGESGHRSLTISNMPDGIYIKGIKKNGSTASQGASFTSFQARVMGQAVTAYIAQLDLLQLSSTAKNSDAEQDERDGFGNGYREEFPDERQFPG